MARLVKDSGVLGKAGEDLTARNLKTKVSFDKMIEAIHVMQGRMNISGTTAKEAAQTIQGSVNSMKAAWSNLLTHLGDKDADLDGYINKLVKSVETVGKNVIPVVETALNGVVNLLDSLLPEVIDRVPALLDENLPKLLNLSVKIIDSLVTSLTENIPKVFTIIESSVQTIVEGFSGIGQKLLPAVGEIFNLLMNELMTLLPKLPEFISNAVPQLISLVSHGITEVLNAINSTIPYVIETAIALFTSFVNSLFSNNNLQRILDAALNIVVTLTNGLLDALPTLLEQLPGMLKNIAQFIIDNSYLIVSTVYTLMSKIVDALPDLIDGIMEAIPGLIETLVELVTNPDNITMMAKAWFNLMASIVKAIVRIRKKMPDYLLGIVVGLIKGFGKLKKLHDAKLGNKIAEFVKERIGKPLSNFIKNFDLKKAFTGLINKITGFFNKAKKAIKTALKEIEGGGGSSSGGEGFGDDVDEGIGKGIEKGKKTKKAVKKKKKEVNKELKDTKETKKAASAFAQKTDSALAEELAKKKEAQKKAKEKAKKIAEEIAKNVAKAKETRTKIQKAANELTAKFYEAINNAVSKGKEEQKKLWDNYKNTVKEAKEKILSVFSLTEAYEVGEKIQSALLVPNALSNLKILKEWKSSLKALKKRIKNSALYKEIEAMGVEGLPTINAFMGLSDSELREYEKAYKERNKIAGDAATEQNKGLKTETQKQVEGVKKSVKAQIKKLIKEYKKDLKELNQQLNKGGNTAGAKLIKGIQQGLNNHLDGLLKSSTKAAKKVVKGINKEFKNIKDPSKTSKSKKVSKTNATSKKGADNGENSELLALTEIISYLQTYLPQIPSDMDMVLDSGVLVGQLTPKINEELGKTYRRER